MTCPECGREGCPAEALAHRYVSDEKWNLAELSCLEAQRDALRAKLERIAALLADRNNFGLDSLTTTETIAAALRILEGKP